MASALPFASLVATLRAAGCVFAEDEAALLIAEAETPGQLAAMTARRVEGEPLEYVLGWAEFLGLRMVVQPGVFVPRHRTEFLVRQAAALAPPNPVVLDVCCGVGALGAALASLVTPAELYAADIDPVAVECARLNLATAGGTVFEGDLYEPLPASLRGRVDILLANAPYVPTDAVDLLPREARLYEARATLDGGADGLDIQRQVVAGAPDWLAPGGRLFVETSEAQAPLSVRAVEDAGLAADVVTAEDWDATVVIGTRAKFGS